MFSKRYPNGKKTKRRGLSLIGESASSITGSRFGTLIVIAIAERRKDRLFWRCACDCGAELTVSQADLKSGRVASCGSPACELKTHAHRPLISYDLLKGTKYEGKTPLR